MLALKTSDRDSVDFYQLEALLDSYQREWSFLRRELVVMRLLQHIRKPRRLRGVTAVASLGKLKVKVHQ